MKRLIWLPLLALAIGGCEKDGPTVLPMSKGMKKTLEARKPPTEESVRASGFKSMAEMEDFRKWLNGGGRRPRELKSLTAAEEQRLHEMLTRKDAPGPKSQAVAAISMLNGPELQKKFVDDVRPLYAEMPKDRALKGLMLSWSNRGGYSFVESLHKDKDPNLAAAAKMGTLQFNSKRPNLGAG